MMNEVLCPKCGSEQAYIGGIHVVFCRGCHNVALRLQSTDEEIIAALDGSFLASTWDDAADVTYEEWRNMVVRERKKMPVSFGVWQ